MRAVSASQKIKSGGGLGLKGGRAGTWREEGPGKQKEMLLERARAGRKEVHITPSRSRAGPWARTGCPYLCKSEPLRAVGAGGEGAWLAWSARKSACWLSSTLSRTSLNGLQ